MNKLHSFTSSSHRGFRTTTFLPIGFRADGRFGALTTLSAAPAKAAPKRGAAGMTKSRYVEAVNAQFAGIFPPLKPAPETARARVAKTFDAQVGAVDKAV